MAICKPYDDRPALRQSKSFRDELARVRAVVKRPPPMPDLPTVDESSDYAKRFDHAADSTAEE